MCKWYCLSEGPSTNLRCLTCGVRYCAACLHGEAGKMTSLVKCAGCGKKPGVKSNNERGAWAAGPGAEVLDGGALGSGGDSDLAFMSGLRDTGARMSNSAAAAARRNSFDSETASRQGSKNSTQGGSRLVGPERFFYDKSTYTGTHTRGGPEHVAKGTGSFVDQSWKRPSVGQDDGIASTLLQNTRAGSKSSSRPTTPAIQVTTPSGHCEDQQLALIRRGQVTPNRSASSGAGSRQGSKESRPVVGPERFFYDKSTYTGCHTRGGPASVAKGSGSSFDQSWKRPN
mmetsp:Transcript_57008/g.121132  ORF Transcript_57008/g.121132 Transcript_57008/m.121132 type:complete len:285 (-) Transcript_57008:229-1083(-)